LDIKQEDLIRFWTWCGWELKQEEVIDASKTKVTIRSAWRNGIETQFPDLDLNSIYKFAIPKLQKEGYSVTLTANEHKGFSVRIQNEIKYSGQEIVIMDSPTEALFNAIMKVIDNETH